MRNTGDYRYFLPVNQDGFGLQDGADIELVVTCIAVNINLLCRIVADELVVARTAIDSGVFYG